MPSWEEAFGAGDAPAKWLVPSQPVTPEPVPAAPRRAARPKRVAPEQPPAAAAAAPKPKRPVGNPRVQAFVDEVRRLDARCDLVPTCEPIITPAVASGVAKHPAPPERIAAAWVHLRHGRWGGKWLQENCTVLRAIQNLDAYREPPMSEIAAIDESWERTRQAAEAKRRAERAAAGLPAEMTDEEEEALHATFATPLWDAAALRHAQNGKNGHVSGGVVSRPV